jgi:hypothetical protein
MTQGSHSVAYRQRNPWPEAMARRPLQHCTGLHKPGKPSLKNLQFSWSIVSSLSRKLHSEQTEAGNDLFFIGANSIGRNDREQLDLD